MNKRITILSMALLASFGMIVVATPSAAQNDLIPDQQTVQAAIQGLFTATARATVYETLALTVDAAFNQTLTATISPSPEFATPTETPLGLNAMTMTDTANRQATQDAQATALAALPLDGDLLSIVVYIPGGQPFAMGTTREEVLAAVDQCVNDENGNCQVEFGEDSLPAHPVTISDFNIERTEVTYRQYVAFLNTLGTYGHLNKCGPLPCVFLKQTNANSNFEYDGTTYSVNPNLLNYPATDVTWDGANAYCLAIGRRLPTEAEWELAARGYDGRIYPWGNEWNQLLAKTSIPEGNPGPAPVGSYPAGASALGVLDMAGNVAEWVSDWYSPTYYQQSEASGLNPQGPQGANSTGVENNQKVIRGGSWDAKPFFARTVHRQSAFQNTTGSWLGFRCASSIGENLPLTSTPTLFPTAETQPTLVPDPSPSPTAAPTAVG